METLAVTAWQPVSSGLFIVGGGEAMECPPGAGDHRHEPCSANLHLPDM